MTTSRSNIDLVKFLFTDGKKFFEAIAYGQEALKFDANLKIGNSYHFENGKIEIPKKLSLRTWANPNNIDYDVTINKNTLIEFFEAKSCSEEIKVTEKENDDFKENKTNKINDGFYKIKDLINVNLTKFKNLQPTVNVIGIIESINELKSIDTKNGPIDCLNFCLIDDEGIYVNCAMWGKQASYFKYKVGQVLIFRNVRVTSYGGCSLSIEKITEISLKPADSNEEQANQVGAFGGQLAALQRAFDDYEESAFSVDADSGRSKTKKKKKKMKDDDSSRGRSNHRSKSRGCSNSTDERKVKNKCKPCKEERPYTGKHDEEKCFYNKKYKGWRPSKICKEMDIKFKRRQEYSSDMGGFASSASEGSSSGSESKSGETSDE